MGDVNKRIETNMMNRRNTTLTSDFRRAGTLKRARTTRCCNLNEYDCDEGEKTHTHKHNLALDNSDTLMDGRVTGLRRAQNVRMEEFSCFHHRVKNRRPSSYRRVEDARPVMAQLLRDPLLLEVGTGGMPVIRRTCLVLEKIFVPIGTV